MALCTTPTTLPSTATRDSQPRRSHLLAEPGELKLRVRGSGHDGRLITIRSPKCTIGSAVGCTLRLRSAGVGPIQCWILRGSGGTIVRRLHGPATLNGGAFEEAALQSGDCLRIGAVELEVVACNQPLAAPASLFPPPQGTLGEVAELQAKLVALTERALRLEAESRQGFQSSIMAAERADQLRDALAAAHEQLAEICRDLAAAQDTASAQAEELESNQSQFSELHASQRSLANQLEDARRLVSASGDERAALTAEVSQARAALDQQRERLDGERTQLERRLEQRDAELDAVRSSAAAQTGAMTVAIGEIDQCQHNLREELSARCADLETQLAGKQSELDELRRTAADHAERAARVEHDLIEAKQAAASDNQQVAAARQQFELERDELLLQQQEVADKQAELSNLQHQLEQQREWVLAGQADPESQENREAQVLEQSANLEAQIVAATARLADLEQLREQLLAQRAALAERTEQLDQRQRELELRAEQLVQQASQLETLRQQWHDRQASAVSSLAAPEHCGPIAGDEACLPIFADCQPAPLAVETAAPPLDLPVNVTAAWSPAALAASIADRGHADDNVAASEPAAPERGNQEGVVALSGVSDDVPTVENVNDSGNVDAVLTRLVKAGLWRNDEQPGPPVGQTCVSAVENASGSSTDGIAAAPAKPARISPANLQPTDSANLTGDDESIESYMERLMNRVRGDSPSGKSGWKQAVEPGSEASPAVLSEPKPEALEASADDAPGGYSPRRTAPELSTNMTAMRELANSAARSAIDRHVRTHTGKQAAGKLLGACLTVTASLVLGYWAYRTQSLQATVGAGIGGALGGYWTWAALRRLAVLRRLDQVQANQAAAANKAEASPAPAPPEIGDAAAKISE